MNTLLTNDPERAAIRKIDFYSKRLDLSGVTLVVVTIGAEVYSACDLEPLTALHAAAFRASEDLAKRRQPVDAKVIIERGRERFNLPRDGAPRASVAQ